MGEKALTVEDVKEWVQKIRDLSTIPESAHAEEDALHEYVLVAIARGDCYDVRGCATAALKTREISFSRWYA